VGVERVGGLQCFKKAQQEIYDESDYDLKQVRPLAVGEVAIHGSCLDTLCCGERFQAGRVVLRTRRRPRVSSPFHGAKVAVVARVRAILLCPFGNVAVNRAAVGSSWGASDSNDNQQSDHQHAEDDYAVGSPTHRNVSFLLQENQCCIFWG
jgi:hypothetical protein